VQALVAEQPQAFLKWVRAPHQARTRKSLNRLLDAAEALLAEKGFDETGIAEITRRAGASVGGFYRRFRDKDGLLHALHERFCEEARATADDAFDPGRWEGAAAAEILTEFIAFLVQIYRERQGLFRAFLLRGVSDEQVQKRTEALFQYLSDGLDTLLATRRDQITHPDPTMAAGFGLRVVLGTLNESLQIHSMPELSDERLVSELARVFTSYLGVRDD